MARRPNRWVLIGVGLALAAIIVFGILLVIGSGTDDVSRERSQDPTGAGVLRR